MLNSKVSYQLTLNDVLPRQGVRGFQLAPNGENFTFILQRDRRDDIIAENGSKKLKTTTLADLCFLPAVGGYPRPLSGSGDYPNPPAWSPDGQWLAVEHGDGLEIISPTGGMTRTIYRGQLYHPPLESGDAWRAYPCWSPDGRALIFATFQSHQTALRLVTIDGKLQRELTSIEGYILGWDWSPDGQQILFVTRNENGWVGDIRLLNIESGAEQVLWPEENYEYQKPAAAWIPGTSSFVFRSNRSGWSKLWIAQAGNYQPQALTNGNWDEGAFRFSPDGEKLVCASRAEQNGNGDDLWIIQLADGKASRLTRHAGVNVPLAWSKGGQIYYWHSSPTERGDLWVVSIAGGQPRQLTHTMPIDLGGKLRAPQEIIVVNPDGTQIPSLIYLPVYYQDGERYPAIVWIHGGPTGISRYDFAPYYNWLANQGYVVISPNFRGSVGYGVTHMAAVSADGLGKNDLSDVLAAGKYVRTLPQVDLRRGVGVGGRSWGGYLTLMAVTQAPDDFSCAVAGAAIADWRIQQAQTEVRYYDRWLVGGWIYEQMGRAVERSPVSFADRLKTPLFVFHGEEDVDVPFAQIGPFVQKARQTGVEVDYMTYPAEGHSNRNPANQQDFLNRTRDFYRRYLQPWNFSDNPSANQVQY